MSISLGNQSLTVTSIKRKWRVNLESPYNGSYSIQAYYEIISTDQNGNVIAKTSADVLNYPLSAIENYVFSLGGGVTMTGAQLAVTISACIDQLLEAPPIVMSSSPSPQVQVGQPYNQGNVASGGTGTITFSLAAGALPAGTTLNAATGTVAGTPTAAGAVSYTIEATDSGSPTPQTATSAITIAIAAN